jgi:hypothetical protein
MQQISCGSLIKVVFFYGHIWILISNPCTAPIEGRVANEPIWILIETLCRNLRGRSY